MSIASVGPQSPVGDWVLERWSRAGTFQALGIDFCCGGKLSLERACQLKGLDLAEVLGKLEAPHALSPEDEQDWVSAPLEALVAHILVAHHDYLKASFPTLGSLVRKVARVHGPAHPELVQLQGVYDRFEGEMVAHMGKEEQVLFPMCLAYARGERPQWGPPIQAPISVMESEHDQAGADLAEMRALTQGFVVPAEACGSWRTMLAGLAELEANTFRHVHLENHLLFPRVLKLAA